MIGAELPAVVGAPRQDRSHPWQMLGSGWVRCGSWSVATLGFISNFDKLSDTAAPERYEDDSQQLAFLLQERGAGLLELLCGNFAVFALCHSRNRLFVCRDRLGGRTLYHARNAGTWYIASTASAVIRTAGLRARMDPISIAAHFAGLSVPAGRSAFEGVHELRPGEILAIDASAAESRFMAVPESCLADYGDTGEAVATFRELFDKAVRDRLSVRDSAACMVSGGMDSGPIAESAARQLAAGGRAFRPISWQLPEFPDADESGWIRTLCRHLDLDPYWFTPACLPYGDLDGSMISPDWPTFNPYRHLVNTCYQMTSESGCWIVLNGNAGDDLYAPIRQLYRGYWKGGEATLIWRDAARIFSQGGLSALLSHAAIRHELGRLRPDWRKTQPPKWLHPRAQPDWLQAAEAQPTFDSYSLPEYAAQLLGPRMTSGRCHEQYFAALYGVERRDPFHDESLVGFMLRAPVSFSVREGRTKWIMREAMRGRIPDSFRLKRRTGLLDSYSRAGIEAHKGSLCRLLFDESPGWQYWVKPEVVRQALDSSGQSGSAVLARCVGYALWARHWSF